MGYLPAMNCTIKFMKSIYLTKGKGVSFSYVEGVLISG